MNQIKIKPLNKYQLVFLWTVFLLISCTKFKNNKDAHSNKDVEISRDSQRAFPEVYFDEQKSRPFLSPLQEITPENMTKELLWALSSCDCAPNIKKAYLKKHAEVSGIMPQVLLPSIRKEIKANPDLQNLFSISKLFGPFSGLLNGLAGGFVSDDELNNEIRKNLANDLKSALKAKELLSDNVKFCVDAFPPTSLKIKNDDLSFETDDQAVRWAFLWSLGDLWEKEPKKEKEYLRSLELLHVVQTVMEWSYLFGILKDENGSQMGGLTLKVTLPKNGDGLKYYDPRLEGKEPRFISGKYKVSFPDKSALSLVLNGGEIWENALTKPTLDEQSRLWIASALAFDRLRKANRPKSLDIFGEDKLLPEEASVLPLAFLAAMQLILDGPFIDQDLRVIYGEGQLGNVKNSQGTSLTTNNLNLADTALSEASLSDYARFLRALYLWNKAFSETSDLEESLDKRFLDQITSGTGDMKRAIQLGVQRIFSRYVKEDMAQDKKKVYFSENDFSQGLVSTSSSAEAIYVLSKIENDLLHSPFLSTRLDEIIAWFYSEKFLSPWYGEVQDKLNAEDVIWLYNLLRDYETTKPEESGAMQMGLAREFLEKVILQWDSGFGD